MIKTIKVASPTRTAAKLEITQSKKNTKLAETILKNVQKYGDAAVRKYEKRFGNTSQRKLKVTDTEIKNAFKITPPIQTEAIKRAKIRLEKTELVIKSSLKDIIVKQNKISLTKKFVPIPSVGCYIPGGLARYPSSVVMSVVPATVAGVKRIAVVSPPRPDGSVDPLTVVAASICGATDIFKVGGAQAIAALSFGTKSIPKVDKIVGPGGSFVTLTKSIISSQTAIDMLAGPTELGIIADDSADPYHIALDLISQAEHSADTRCYVITNSAKLAKSVRLAISKIEKNIKRQEIVRSSLNQNGFVAVCRTQKQMIELAELLAPEHLQIMTSDSKKMASKITSAGLVLIGAQSPSAASDYLFGSNHILPTNRFGRTRGSLSVLDFVKLHTEVESSREALVEIADHLQSLTYAEELPNHYEAVKGRLK